MRPLIDIASRVSEELSQILESAVNDPDIDESPTLGSVRKIIAESQAGESFEADRLHFDQSQSLLEEIGGLIEQCGDDAPAIDFVTVKASEDLSCVIEAIMNTGASPPTLEVVRNALLQGLVARLVGEGAIDPDEDETLQEEIETLIVHYGKDAAAENFLRYE
ncbi:MAG: hypothetical protein ACYC05_11900 [Sulfuricella sp.]|nr:hypothetical protein [Gammaproteobacteria bacterium]